MLSVLLGGSTALEHRWRQQGPALWLGWAVELLPALGSAASSFAKGFREAGSGSAQPPVFSQGDAVSRLLSPLLPTPPPKLAR